MAAFMLGLLRPEMADYEAAIFAAQAAAVVVGKAGTSVASYTDILEAISRGAL